MIKRANIKRINIAEFREHGYLHEVNRLVLHPLGLALEVETEPCLLCAVEAREDCATCGGRGRVERLGGVWDCREHPEGMTYGVDLLSPEKAIAVFEEMMKRRSERVEACGWVIQPIKGHKVLTTNYTDPSFDEAS